MRDFVETIFMPEAQAMQAQLVAWRRQLHQIPETGLTLPQTMAFLADELDKMGISYRRYDRISCMEATIGAGERCFLLRSDVDALPVSEEAQVPFRAKNGNMHACGHDLHGAILLGAAKLLKAHEKALPGRVKLLFQSGEEIFRGAQAAADAGVLTDVDGAFAMHVLAAMPMGTIVTGETPTACADGFAITVTGRAGHGSMPETTVDPINAAVQIYLALQALIAREVGGTQEAVLTIGQLCAGQTANAIPEKAVLQGTLRTFDEKLRGKLWQRIEQMSDAVARAYRCACEVCKISECAALVTDARVTAVAECAIKKELPQLHLIKGAHGMGSEDFAQIAKTVPAAYFMLGAAPQDENERFAQHDPRIVFNEDVLCQGAAIYAQTAVQWLNNAPQASE